jgi:hypothetical protein
MYVVDLDCIGMYQILTRPGDTSMCRKGSVLIGEVPTSPFLQESFILYVIPITDTECSSMNNEDEAEEL